MVSPWNRSILVGLLGMLSGTVATADDFATTMHDATYKLFHADSTATCFLVRREAPDRNCYLVTAAHVLERIKGNTAILVLRDRRDTGSYKRRDHTLAIRRNDKPLWVRHASEDVAVLRLAELPEPFDTLPLATVADEARLSASGLRICSPVFVLTYPLRFEANDAGFAVARQGIIAGSPLLPTRRYRTFLADFTAIAGDSGGPVFAADKDDTPLLIGIVLARHHHDQRVTTEYEDRTLHHPLGLGIVLHAQFVREAIEAAAKPNEADVE